MAPTFKEIQAEIDPCLNTETLNPVLIKTEELLSYIHSRMGEIRGGDVMTYEEVEWIEKRINQQMIQFLQKISDTIVQMHASVAALENANPRDEAAIEFKKMAGDRWVDLRDAMKDINWKALELVPPNLHEVAEHFQEFTDPSKNGIQFPEEVNIGKFFVFVMRQKERLYAGRQMNAMVCQWLVDFVQQIYPNLNQYISSIEENVSEQLDSKQSTMPEQVRLKQELLRWQHLSGSLFVCFEYAREALKLQKKLMNEQGSAEPQ